MRSFSTKGNVGVQALAELSGYCLLITLGIFLFYQFLKQRETATDAALTAFKARQAAESEAVALGVESGFRQMYQGLRTIARLPGVRNLGKDSAALNDDARVSAQEIYNNLAENLSVSEFYIVPVGFNPDRIDPATGEPEKPIMTFDQLIVGRNADEHKPQSSRLRPTDIDEIEIFEYRVMKRQIDYMRAYYPSEDSVSALAYPAITSEEVITCDNRRYSPTAPDDNDRKGILYSVPFYGMNGELRGIVTAIVLSSVLSELLPNGRHALRDTSLRLTIGLDADQFWKKSLSNNNSNGRPEELLYSEFLPLKFPHVSRSWQLWSGASPEAFFAAPEVRAINTRFWMQTVSVVLALSMLIATLDWLTRRSSAIQKRNAELEERVKERTAALVRATEGAEVANAAKSQFLARVSHEIRTPIHAIMSAADLLETSRLYEAAAAKVEMIKSASRALLELVNQVLDLSAIERGRIELAVADIDPRQLINETCEMMRASAQRKGLGLHCEVEDGTPPTFSTDPSRTREVLINLVGNAIKYTDQGGVRVTVGPAGDGSLQFTVADTGPGIPEDQLQRIFSAFHRGGGRGMSSDGAGLGLAISRQLVSLLGGTISAENRQPLGALFRFTIAELPKSSDTQSPTRADAGRRSPQSFSLSANILLAEDDERMRDLTKELLEQFGCTVYVAQNGLEAVSLSRQVAFDIVLMDCSMPKLDGIEAARLIRQHAQEVNRNAVPIVALTAHAFAADRAACLDAGMTDFLSKPFTRDELYQVLQRTLKAPAARPEAQHIGAA